MRTQATLLAATATLSSSPGVAQVVLAPVRPPAGSIATGPVVGGKIARIDPAILGQVPVEITVAGGGTVQVGTAKCAPKGAKTTAVCERWVKKNEKTVFQAVPGPGSQFGGWAGACSGFASSCTISPGAKMVLAAIFLDVAQNPTKRLSITITTNGMDPVTLETTPNLAFDCATIDPASNMGGAFGGLANALGDNTYACKADVPQGQGVGIRASRGYGDAKAYFKGYMFGADCTGHTSAAGCFLTMDKPQSVILDNSSK